MTKSYRNSLPATVLVLGAILLLTVGLTHVVPFGTGSLAGSMFRDSLHAPVFALLTIGIVIVLSRQFAPLLTYPLAFGAAFATGLGGEVFQAIGPGDASWRDLGSDLIGIAAGLLLAAALDRRLSKLGLPVLRLAASVAGLLLFAAAVTPAARMALVFKERDDRLPVIYAPGEDWQQAFVRFQYGARAERRTCPEAWTCRGPAVTLLSFGRYEYGGLAIETAADWRHYVYLNVPIQNVSAEPVTLTLSVNDTHYNNGYTDRFSYHFEVPRQPSQLKIPLDDILNAPSGRHMDMQSISHIYLFMDAPDGTQRILLGQMFLSMQ